MNKPTKDTVANQAEVSLAADVQTAQEDQSIHTPKKAETPKEKASLHPTYFPEAKVVCACGTTFTIGSTKPEIHIEVCSNCHPFFTGKAKFVDTEGRVQAFERRVAAQQSPKDKKKVERTAPERPKSLKEMLELTES